MSISAALTQIKTLLEGIDPSPADALTAAYVYPDDEPIVFRADDLPVAVVRRDPLVTSRSLRQTKGTYYRIWSADIRIYFAETSVPNKGAEALYANWEGKLETAFFADPTLGGTCEFFGNETGAGGLEMFLGHIGMFHSDVGQATAYWGIKADTLITTEHTYAESYAP